WVSYHVLEGNRYLNVQPDGSGTSYLPGGMLSAYSGDTKRQPPDGHYSIVVAPGPGLVLVRADARRFPEAFVNPTEFFPGKKFDRSGWGDETTLLTPIDTRGTLMLPQNWYREIVPILPDVGSNPLTLDVELRPAPEVRTVFLDPDGKPLGG